MPSARPARKPRYAPCRPRGAHPRSPARTDAATDPQDHTTVIIASSPTTIPQTRRVRTRSRKVRQSRRTTVFRRHENDSAAGRSGKRGHRAKFDHRVTNSRLCCRMPGRWRLRTGADAPYPSLCGTGDARSRTRLVSGWEYESPAALPAAQDGRPGLGGAHRRDGAVAGIRCRGRCAPRGSALR
jgi:5-methylcytosine-specific restriction endonuclease McrA